MFKLLKKARLYGLIALCASCSTPYNELKILETVKPNDSKINSGHKITESMRFFCAKESLKFLSLKLNDKQKISIMVAVGWIDFVKINRALDSGGQQIIKPLTILSQGTPITVYQDNIKNSSKYDYTVSGYLAGLDEDIGEASSGIGQVSRALRLSVGKHYSDSLIQYVVHLKMGKTNKVISTSDPVRVLRKRDKGIDSKGRSSSGAIVVEFDSGLSHSKTLFTQSMMNDVAVDFMEALLGMNLGCPTGFK